MMYTVKALARLTGLTPRTLRYYDSIGLLCPLRGKTNGYRFYGPEEVDRLQQILLYRDIGLPLEKIKNLLDAPDFDRETALREHLVRLQARRQEVDALIHTVQNTLQTIEGGTAMNDIEKFEGMKRQAIQENEAAYGQELREKYGEEAIKAHNQRLSSMTRQEWEQAKRDEEACKSVLRRAAAAGDPTGENAREAIRLHAVWLAHYWPKDALTPEAHIAVTKMYTQDERFTAYYERIIPNGAAFLAEAAKACYQP